MARATSMYTRNFILILIAFGIQAESTILGPQPDWNNQLDFNDIERRLKTEAIVERTDIRSFLKKSNKVYRGHPSAPEIIVLESGLKAVFKTCNSCYGEVAAYKAAKALGLRLVPPTILRTIQGKTGSLQFYVASKIDLVQVGRGVYEKLDPKDLSDMELFRYIFNRWDVNKGNQIVTEHQGSYYLALIDNATNVYLSHKPKLNLQSVAASTLIALKKINNTTTLREIWSDSPPLKKYTGPTDDRKYVPDVDAIVKRTSERIKLLLEMTKKKKNIVNQDW